MDEMNPDDEIKEEFSPETEEMISTEEIPIELHVEVGTILMDLKKVLQLKPGNLLELGIKPEQGVNLMVHGKPFAKGELLQVGDVLGVRIIKLAK